MIPSRWLASAACLGAVCLLPGLISTSPAQASKPGPASAAPPAGPTQQAARSNPTAPGQFEVSEDDADRALERTLVATGNLLVPAGFAEAEPLFSYTRRESPFLIVSQQNRNEFAWALDLRLGLPWESQFEIGVPYNLVQQQATDGLSAPPQLISNRWPTWTAASAS